MENWQLPIQVEEYIALFLTALFSTDIIIHSGGVLVNASGIQLGRPDEGLPLYRVLAKRRSVREFEKRPISLPQLSSLLWAAYGLTNTERRTVPSAGATYPLEIYVAASRVEGLEPGVYRYIPEENSIELVKKGDVGGELARACLGQEWVEAAPINIIVAAVPSRTTNYYGRRGVRYTVLEAGHAGQNIYLMATELGLGTVAVGAFRDNVVKEVLGLNEEMEVLYVFPVGYPAE